MDKELSKSKVLAVIPARGGSKGIPRKNARILGDKPLIAHSIEKAKEMSSIDKVVLTTDDGELARIGRSHEADKVIDRPQKLSTDEVPLAPVIKHAVEEQEKKYHYIICFQPTTPLISKDSLKSGIDKMRSQDGSSLIFVSQDTEHYWKGGNQDKTLLTGARENRQLLEPIYNEIGVFISERDLIKEGKRIDDQPLFQEVPRKEAIDIDHYSDWIIAESEIEKKKIIYRSVGSEETGLGHISRGITIAKRIVEHEIEFAIREDQNLAKELLEENNLKYHVFENEERFNDLIQRKNPDIIVNDILDTEENYVSSLKNEENRVVNFEDMGRGARKTDAVINALYERSSSRDNEFYGSEYICLRDEFRYTKSKKEIGNVDRIMISYGGVDENNLTLKTVKAIENACEDKSGSPYIDIVLGLGYENKKELKSYLESSNLEYEINQNIDWISEHMAESDLLFTSNGRTVYEAASLNIPMISISQNTREVKHLFSEYNDGVKNLGIAREVEKSDIIKSFKEYKENEERRTQMINSLKQENLTEGINSVKEIILGEH
jgi:CMP-N-acetylneuraminic acid synthetase/spore coat polysaccharide biosynthesis predicted glycosyltransferase SpsG